MKLCYVIPFNHTEEKEIKKLNKLLSSVKADTIVVLNGKADCLSVWGKLAKNAKHIISSYKKGAAAARNKGCQFAHELGYSVIMFQDYDDKIKTCGQTREDITKEIFKNPDVGVLYSPFICVDDCDNKAETPPHMTEIEEVFKNPVEGKCWLDIGTKSGYISLTSGVAVRSKIAVELPFSEDHDVSEDYYAFITWATKYNFKYTDLYYVEYNVSSDYETKYSGFLKKKLKADLEAFIKCCDLTNIEDRDYQIHKHLIKSAESMRKSGSEFYYWEAKNLANQYLNNIMQKAL